ncbi:hypothetical protein YC2023_017746 [Brassica napus]
MVVFILPTVGFEKVVYLCRFSYVPIQQPWRTLPTAKTLSNLCGNIIDGDNKKNHKFLSKIRKSRTIKMVFLFIFLSLGVQFFYAFLILQRWSSSTFYLYCLFISISYLPSFNV